ncbi:TetR/AcrR family transcriptional regulator [Neorhizobium sp. BT27B]|uniref:TetR family transcriptional regulator n=1 Tax=Neorhizobium sp. BT27B TaxID=3142625 RepID=UPI003D277EF0
MTRNRPSSKPKPPILRRSPKQARSRDRVTEILKVSADLIGEKGIDAVTMKEIGSKSGGPIASVYQYFPDKAAILATLYEAYVAETRAILQATIANIRTAQDAMVAPGQLLDAYYKIMQKDASAIEILNAIKASKLLGQQDIEETRAQVQDFYDATAGYVKAPRRDEYKGTLFILSNMADACVRLALMHPRPQAAAVVENFKGIVNAQAAEFIGGIIPAGFLLPPGVRPQ